MLAAIGLAAGAVGAAAPAATAGEIDVYACAEPNGTPLPVDNWREGGWIWEAATFYYDRCAQEDRSFGVTSLAGAHRAHVHRTLTFEAPDGTWIRKLRVHRSWWGTEWTSWHVFRHREPFYATGFHLHQCFVVYGCTGPDYAELEFGIDSDVAMILYESCAVDTGCSGGEGNLRLWRTVVTLQDEHDPTYSDRSGSLMTAGAKTGRVGLTAQVVDRGVGLYRVGVLVDGKSVSDEIVNSNGGKCRVLASSNGRGFGWAVPCRLNATISPTLNTATLRDGTHAVAVWVSDASGNRTTVFSDNITTENRPVNTSLPRVTGRNGLRVGSVVEVDRGAWDRDPTSYEVQWLRCETTDVSSCAEIPGATGDTYEVTPADSYRHLRAQVRASNTGGSTTAISEASAVVADEAGYTTPAPQLVVTPRWSRDSNVSQPTPGDRLTIESGDWHGQDVTIAYRFQRCANGVCTPINDWSSTSSYVVADADIGSSIVGEVTASNRYGSTSFTLPATATVTQAERGVDDSPQPKPSPGIDPPTPSLPPITVPTPNGGSQQVAVPNGVCEGGRARLTARIGRRSSATVAWGRGATATFTLTCLATGKPISGAELAVAVSTPTSRTARSSTLKTDARGIATLRLPKGVSRSIVVGWRRDSLATTYAAQASAKLLVRSRVTFKLAPRKVRERGTVRMSGQVAGAAKGILLNVQALNGRRWRTFDQVRTSKAGKFRYTYRFSPRTRAGASFRFRVQLVAGQKKLATVPVASKAVGVRIVR